MEKLSKKAFIKINEEESGFLLILWNRGIEPAKPFLWERPFISFSSWNPVSCRFLFFFLKIKYQRKCKWQLPTVYYQKVPNIKVKCTAKHSLLWRISDSPHDKFNKSLFTFSLNYHPTKHSTCLYFNIVRVSAIPVAKLVMTGEDLSERMYSVP